MQELLGRIRQEQESFPAAQRLVAAYVVENYNQIPFLSITALAKNIGVSDNTVIKFCNHLGYGKFTEFKRVFADYAHSELTMFNKLTGEEGTADDASLFAEEMEESIARIRAAMNDPVNRENLPRVISMMNNADHIYITGGRASGVLAQFTANALRYLDLKVHDVTFGVGDYLDRLSMARKTDLVIAFSFPRYTAQVVSALKQLHDNGVPVILITDKGLSPAYPYADTVLHSPVNSSSYFLCYSGCLALVNTIFRAMAASRKKGAAAHVQKLEEMLLDQGVFL